MTFLIHQKRKSKRTDDDDDDNDDQSKEVKCYKWPEGMKFFIHFPFQILGFLCLGGRIEGWVISSIIAIYLILIILRHLAWLQKLIWWLVCITLSLKTEAKNSFCFFDKLYVCQTHFNKFLNLIYIAINCKIYNFNCDSPSNHWKYHLSSNQLLSNHNCHIINYSGDSKKTALLLTLTKMKH